MPQFVKSGQIIWAGLSPPSFGQNPKEQLLFFVKPFHKRDILLFLYWSIVKRTVFFLFVCQDWQGGLVTGIFVFACLLVYTE